MTAPSVNTEPISVQEAMLSSLGTAEMISRLEAARPISVPVLRSGTAARRLTYQPAVNQRALVLTATSALLVTVALQAFGVATLF
jgi:hypothetical protein